MERASLWTAIAILLGPTVAAGQELPPDIQVDLYLVRAERQIQSQDYAAALETLDIVLALQANYGMETPAGLWFRHAQVALDAGYPRTTITSVTRYLLEAGRDGEDYTTALRLLDEAERLAAGAEIEIPAPTPAAPTAVPVAEPSETRGGLTLLFPLVGVNAANMAVTSSGPLTVDASQITGVAGGLAVAYPVGDGPFGIQLGAQYAQKGARIAMGDGDATANADISFQSVDFLALARISPPSAANLPLYALVGSYASLEVGCRVAVDAGAGTERFNTSDDCSNANLDTQSLDFGLSGGVGFEMGTGVTRITVGLLYSYGLQDIDKYTGETAKHRVLNVHAGVATTF